VQQGDPLGPLLFCLVLRHVSLGISDVFASAEPIIAALNTSYLDGGVIGHTLGTLSRVWSYLQSPQVQDLDMSLNLAKCFVYQPSSRPIPHLLPVKSSSLAVMLPEYVCRGLPLVLQHTARGP
jgi:hypothetical protein